MFQRACATYSIILYTVYTKKLKNDITHVVHVSFFISSFLFLFHHLLYVHTITVSYCTVCCMIRLHNTVQPYCTRDVQYVHTLCTLAPVFFFFSYFSFLSNFLQLSPTSQRRKPRLLHVVQSVIELLEQRLRKLVRHLWLSW